MTLSGLRTTARREAPSLLRVHHGAPDQTGLRFHLLAIGAMCPQNLCRGHVPARLRTREDGNSRTGARNLYPVCIGVVVRQVERKNLSS